MDPGLDKNSNLDPGSRHAPFLSAAVSQLFPVLPGGCRTNSPVQYFLAHEHQEVSPAGRAIGPIGLEGLQAHDPLFADAYQEETATRTVQHDLHAAREAINQEPREDM